MRWIVAKFNRARRRSIQLFHEHPDNIYFTRNFKCVGCGYTLPEAQQFLVEQFALNQDRELYKVDPLGTYAWKTSKNEFDFWWTEMLEL